MQQWNIDLLNELYNKYYKLSLDTQDPTLSLQYESTANSILDIIDRYDELTSKGIRTLNFKEPFNHKDVIANDFSVISHNGYFCPIVRKLAEYNDSLIIKPNTELPIIDASTGKILSVSHDFYSQFKGVFFDKYLGLEKNFRDTIHFKKISPKTITAGQTYSVYKTNLTFFELGYNNTAQDYVSAIHEFGHGVSTSINPDALWDYGKYCFIEIDSLFFELLGTDYIWEVLGNKKDSYDISMQVLKDYIYSSMLITTKLDMYSENDRLDLNNKRFVKKYLKEKANLNNLGVNDVMKTYIRDLMHYIVSFLSAIELYLIYKECPNTALDLLFKIIVLKKDSSKDYLDSIRVLGIEPGVNFEKYVSLLMEKAKELNDEKNLQYKN